MAPGPPGARWRNLTGHTWYQWVSDLIKPCARCLRRHGRLFPRAQGKLHPNCRCHELAVEPGAVAPIQARAPMQVARLIPESGLESMLGADTMRVVRAGLVPLSAVIGDDETGWLLLAFTELVRRRGLSYSQLVGAGVDAATARRATGPLEPARAPADK